jgi:hypothetical protein
MRDDSEPVSVCLNHMISARVVRIEGFATAGGLGFRAKGKLKTEIPGKEFS